jgi:hypothetical protein
LINLYAAEIDRPVWAHAYFLVDFKDETFRQAEAAGESTLFITAISFEEGEHLKAPIAAHTR